MTERKKLAAGIIDEVSCVVENQHPEIERVGDNALVYGPEYYELEESIIEMLPSNESDNKDKIESLERQVLQLERMNENQYAMIMEYRDAGVHGEEGVQERIAAFNKLTTELSDSKNMIVSLEGEVKARHKEARALTCELSNLTYECEEKRKKVQSLTLQVEELTKVTAHQASWILEFTGSHDPD
jgi:chromosome segregation ATPase